MAYNRSHQRVEQPETYQHFPNVGNHTEPQQSTTCVKSGTSWLKVFYGVKLGLVMCMVLWGPEVKLNLFLEQTKLQDCTESPNKWSVCWWVTEKEARLKSLYSESQTRLILTWALFSISPVRRKIKLSVISRWNSSIYVSVSQMHGRIGKI